MKICQTSFVESEVWTIVHSVCKAHHLRTPKRITIKDSILTRSGFCSMWNKTLGLCSITGEVITISRESSNTVSTLSHELAHIRHTNHSGWHKRLHHQIQQYIENQHKNLIIETPIID